MVFKFLSICCFIQHYFLGYGQGLEPQQLKGERHLLCQLHHLQLQIASRPKEYFLGAYFWLKLLLTSDIYHITYIFNIYILIFFILISYIYMYRCWRPTTINFIRFQLLCFASFYFILVILVILVIQSPTVNDSLTHRLIIFFTARS